MLGQNGRGEWSLVFFTILTQMSVGIFAIWGLIDLLALNSILPTDACNKPILLTTLLLLIIGGISAFLHLGNPLRAGFALRNLGSSWLSREELFSGLFGLLVLLILVGEMTNLDLGFFSSFEIILAIVCGLLLIYSISRLYMLRTVPAWNNFGTPAAFFISALLLGTLAITSIGIYVAFVGGWIFHWFKIAIVIIAILMSLQLMISAATWISLNSQGGAAADSVRYLWIAFRGMLLCRWAAALGSIGIGLAILVFKLPPGFIFIAFILVIISEFLGRFLFYGFYRRVGF